jgi:hypothetical protein
MNDRPIPEEVTLITSGVPSRPDHNLAKLVTFCGLNCSHIDIAGSRSASEQIESRLAEGSCLMANAATLAEMPSGADDAEKLLDLIKRRSAYLFLYNISAEAGVVGAVSSLTSGAVRKIAPVEPGALRFTIAGDRRSICGQLSGLSFEQQYAKTDHIFVLEHSGADTVELVSVNGKTLFALYEGAPCSIFVLGCSRVIDMDEMLPGRFNIKQYFPETAPAMLFLRFVFGERCWHSGRRFANFIIDDPLLRERYGFIDFQRLVREMDEHDYFTTVAFIPWNHRRSDKKAADLFSRRRDRLSICIHGCNHMHNEFGVRDEKSLDRISRLALVRMNAHREAFGIDYDDVMVFPQGNFSSLSMKVLKANDYLAAVNSRFRPTGAVEGFKVSSLLDVAVMDFSSFPLFLRRYPKDLVESAFDLFLGKPALIVLHHDVFRDGYGAISAFASGINGLDPDVRWDNMRTVIRDSYLERTAGDGSIHTRIYANRCAIRNELDVPRTFHIEKRETGDVPIEDVRVDGKTVPFVSLEGVLRLTAEIAARSTAAVTIAHRSIDERPPDGDSTALTIKTAFRRYLSEFRDNYMSRNRFLLTTASRLVHARHKSVQSK